MKEEKYYIGKFLSDLRKQQGLSIEELCKGLCKKGKLSKIERGEQLPEKILVDALCERLGTSMDYYGILYGEEEYAFSQAKSEIQELLQDGYYEEAEEKAEELKQQIRKKAEPLWEQFFRQIMLSVNVAKKVPLRELEEEVLEIIHLTLPDFPDQIQTLRYSETELSLLAFYGEVLWDKGQNEESLHLFSYLVQYVEAKLSDPHERVKVYPNLALLLARKKLEMGESIQFLYDNTLRLLREEHSLYGLREWLLFRQEEANRKDGTFFGKVEKEALNLLSGLSEKKSEIADTVYFFQSARRRGTLISYQFRSLRKHRGCSQEEFVTMKKAASTISRIENGQMVPRQKTYQFLMEQFGSERERYQPFLKTNDLYFLQMRRKLVFALESKQFEQAEGYLEILERGLDKEETLNKQALLYYRTALDWRFERKDPSELLTALKEALSLTIPENCRIEEWPVSQMENTIWNLIAIIKARTGRRQEAITLLQRLLQSYENNPVKKEDNVTAYLLSLNNLVNYLGSEGNHEEAIQLSKEETKLAFLSRKAYVLVRSLYDRVWSKEMLQEEKNACLKELRQAFCLATLIHYSYMQKLIEQHCQEHYQISLEEWGKE